MAANQNPIFTLTPNLTVGQTISAANTAKDGTGTVVTVFTAGTNGSYIYQVVFQPIGTNIASAGRIFINNGSTNTVATNNSYAIDFTLAATTNSEVAGIGQTVVTLNRTIPAGYKLNVTLGTAVAAGFAVYTIAEDY